LASNISSIETIERYLDNQEKIQPLLESIMETLSDEKILTDAGYQESVISNISKVYPYLDMIYSLSESGEQLIDTTLSPKSQRKFKGLSDKNIDRSNRPYFISAKESDAPVVTKPYLSITDGALVVSAATKVLDKDKNVAGYVVCDFDLVSLMSHFMGDARRNKYVPYFNI